MLSSASPLQALQLIDGVDELALNRGFVAQDAVEVSTQGQTEMIFNWCQFRIGLMYYLLAEKPHQFILIWKGRRLRYGDEGTPNHPSFAP